MAPWGAVSIWINREQNWKNDILLCLQCTFLLNASSPLQLSFIDNKFSLFLTVKSYMFQLKNPSSLYKINNEEIKNEPHKQKWHWIMTRDLPLLNLCEITQSLKIKLTAQKQAPANKKNKTSKRNTLVFFYIKITMYHQHHRPVLSIGWFKSISGFTYNVFVRNSLMIAF